MIANGNKLITIMFLLCLTGCSQDLGADLQIATEAEKIDIEKTKIEAEQQTEVTKTGKYKQELKYEKEGMEYEIHEYLRPDGSVGYQVIIYKDNMNMSIGYGDEAKSRTWDWQIIETEEDL